MVSCLKSPPNTLLSCGCATVGTCFGLGFALDSCFFATAFLGCRLRALVCPLIVEICSFGICSADLCETAVVICELSFSQEKSPPKPSPMLRKSFRDDPELLII
ncbi:hypothetical protein HPP92_012613 [Vanilla planifolia]|uniref:Uncharacterized protein n=1 Tax=Vanilla planifolia TaxID=51239 RepID=A0A835R596_VANPL|nr:hypothetical protein HPP92_012613 [Vanilla planifolia]